MSYSINDYIAKYLKNKGYKENSAKFVISAILLRISYTIINFFALYNLGIILILIVSAYFLFFELDLWLFLYILLISTLITFFYKDIMIKFGRFLLPLEGEMMIRGIFFSRKVGRASLPIFIDQNVIIRNPKNVELGNGVKIFQGTFLDAGVNGYIKIGDETHIDAHSVIYGQGGLEIGCRCAVSSVKIYSQTNQYKSNSKMRIIDQPIIYKKVTIGDDVSIGAGSVILPGITIGDGAIIGASSVIIDDIPKNTVAVGTPARPIKNRF